MNIQLLIHNLTFDAAKGVFLEGKKVWSRESFLEHIKTLRNGNWSNPNFLVSVLMATTTDKFVTLEVYNHTIVFAVANDVFSDVPLGQCQAASVNKAFDTVVEKAAAKILKR